MNFLARTRKWFFSLLRFALPAILLVTAVTYYQQRNLPKGLAPQLSGVSLSGGVVDLQQMRERGPVLIYFWATWCGYCRVVSPAVSDLSAKHRVIGVALQSGTDSELREYQRKHALQFPTLNDHSGALSSSWGVRVTPTIVIVGSDGKVHWVTSGATSKWGLQLRLALTK